MRGLFVIIGGGMKSRELLREVFQSCSPKLVAEENFHLIAARNS